MRPVCEMREMDLCASSASLLEEELASAIEPAVKAAVLSVMSALAKFVDSKCAVFHLRLDERDKEFESVRLRLEIAESELKTVRERECTNTADNNFTHSLTNTDEQYCGSDGIIAHVLSAPARDRSTAPVQPTRELVPAVQSALKSSRVLIQEDVTYSVLMRGDEHRGHTSTAGGTIAVKGPAERNALPHAEEGSKAESVPIQEELFDQEWCRSPKQATELTSIEGEEEKPGLDPVHIKKEDPGTEPVIIKEEVLELESDPIEEGGADHFERWQQITTGEKLHCCTECGKSFTQLQHLKTHLRVHTGEKPYSCTQCGKRFTQRKTLKTHLRIHTGEKPYSCTQCGKRFRQQNTLKTHLRIHTGEKPFSCTQCGKCFIQQHSLKTHLRHHTGEKPYCCSQCGKSFTQLHHLKTHRRTHTGEK
ncbi:zinc finger protein 135-like [Acipenser ruthenus]|uniref:zinc finger protein 135-like n=1 Tax=Acipenser ruthenus TaxID=7906 RepID=UPI002741F70F|nr:zinc finger protein 135-like [Acipenser ruthenus]